jgi:3-oxoacyl-[acyl-carrier protein] reductase
MMQVSDLFSLRNKVALVTGAGKGIGHVISKVFLDAGAHVAIHYRSSNRGAESLVSAYGNERCRTFKADFEEPSAPEQLFNAVWNWRKRIDILVNCAALIEAVPLEQLQEDHLIRTFRVNSVAPFLLSKQVLVEMRRAKSGHIVSISSIGVKFAGSPRTAHYMISKAALEAGTLALAKAFAAEGVMINVVRAGVTLTPEYVSLGRDIAARESLIPMKRAASPDEIAKAVLFLVSPLNTYITGAVIPVAGGE